MAEIRKGTLAHLKQEIEELMRVNPWAGDAVLECPVASVFGGLELVLNLCNDRGLFTSSTPVQRTQHANSVKLVVEPDIAGGDVLRLKHFGKKDILGVKLGAKSLLEQMEMDIQGRDEQREMEFLLHEEHRFHLDDTVLFFPDWQGRGRWKTITQFKETFPLSTCVVDAPEFLRDFFDTTKSVFVYRCKYKWQWLHDNVFMSPFEKLVSRRVVDSVSLECQCPLLTSNDVKPAICAPGTSVVVQYTTRCMICSKEVAVVGDKTSLCCGAQYSIQRPH